jgi:hypothetical protein
MLFEKTLGLCCENHTKHTDTLFGQNAEFVYVDTCGIHSNHWDLQGYRVMSFLNINKRDSLCNW